MHNNYIKKRILVIMTGLTFFIITSIGLSYLLKINGSDILFGFNIDGKNIFSFFDSSGSVMHAQDEERYPNGEVSNQVILVNLNEGIDSTPWLNEEKLNIANELLNGEGESLKTYIRDMSYESVQVTSVLHRNASDGNDGFMPDHPKSYYIDTSKDAVALEEELLRDILAKYEIDGSLKNTSKEILDTNDDGFLDNVTFVLRGDANKEHNILWPHQYVLNNDGDMDEYPEVSVKDNATLKVKDYNIILSGDGNEPNSIGIFNAENNDLGVIVHEYLHMYGLPDLYHNYKLDEETQEFRPLTNDEQNGDPLGKWDIMDFTIQKKPQNSLVYTNKMYSPWGNKVPDFETIDTSTQSISLPKVAYNNGEETLAKIIKIDPSLNKLAEDEYFVVEYRKQSSWDSELPDSGLLVYRINTAANHKNEHEKVNAYCDINKDSGEHCGNMFGTPDEVYIFRPNADNPMSGNAIGNTDVNLNHAALSKDKGLGKSLEEVQEFTQETFADTIYFSDGSNSGIVISNVSDTTSDTISFDIDIPEGIDDASAPIIDEPTGNGINGNWIHDTPTISVHVSDTGQGIASVTVKSEDGGIVSEDEIVQTYTETYRGADRMKNTNFSFKATTNGTYTIQAKDHNDNVSDIKTIVVENIDNVAPTIEVGKKRRHGDVVTLPVTFNDFASKIDTSSAFYKTVELNDITDGLNYDQPIKNNEIILSDTFVGKVCITVKDIAGNEAKNPSCWVISDDTNVPVIRLSTDGHKESWVGTNQKIEVVATEDKTADTGIHYVEVTTQDGRINATDERYLQNIFEKQGTTSESFAFEVKSNGTYEVLVCDYAQNCSTEKLEVTNVDQETPIISDIYVKDEKSYALFKTGAHTINFEVSDEPLANNSGVQTIYYQLVSEEDTYVEDKTNGAWLKTNTEENIYTDEAFVGKIYAYAVDGVGNTSRIHVQDIQRVSNYARSEFIDGKQDVTNTVSIKGLQADVVIDYQELSIEDYSTMMDQDYVSSHSLQKVHEIKLMNEGSPYTLQEEVRVRIAMDSALLKDSSLEFVSFNDAGEVETIPTIVADDYVEFKVSALSKLAAFTQPKGEKEPLIVNFENNRVLTGDHTNTSVFSVGMLVSIGGIAYLMYRKQKQMK